MALGECREGPTDATGRSAQARGQERWSSQGLRETVGVCVGGVLLLGVLPTSCPSVGVGTGLEMLWGLG